MAGSCFWQAFQQCRPASLTVNFGGVDTVTTHTFTLQKNNTSCTISDAVKNRIIPRPAKDTGTYTCSGLVNAANELRFNGCGTLGNIVVPTSPDRKSSIIVLAGVRCIAPRCASGDASICRTPGRRRRGLLL